MKNLQLSPSSPLMQRDFIFGVATSSFQIEGDVAGRLPCIWDTFCQQPGAIADGSNGDVACDHVVRWQQDVLLLQQMNVDAYRLSISWPRVMTQAGDINESGLDFYIQLIETLNRMNIEVFVTLYHWDLPQYLEDQGGWLNRETAYEFANYAAKVTERLGDRVSAYATFNEPFCSAYLGYEVGVHAPGKTGRASGRQAAHHILLAHGLAMPLIRRHCPTVQAGIVLNFTPCYPNTEQAEDIAATRLADEYINLWYLQPLLEGTYPDVMMSLAEKDRPVIEDGDMNIIKQPLDFLGVNFYTRLHYSAATDADSLYTEHDHREPKTAIGWEIYPDALRELFIQLHQRFNLPPVYITENGAAMVDELQGDSVIDEDRIGYFQQHLEALEAAVQAGVCVKGYFAWSLMDNFEWAEGYTQRFGLVHVNFDTQQRRLKQSALAWQALLQQKRELHQCHQD